MAISMETFIPLRSTSNPILVRSRALQGTSFHGRCSPRLEICSQSRFLETMPSLSNRIPRGWRIRASQNRRNAAVQDAHLQASECHDETSIACRGVPERPSESCESAPMQTTSQGVAVWRTALLGVASSLLLPVLQVAAEVAERAPISCEEELAQLGGADLNTILGIAAIAELVALTGAAVGGVLARQRKQELEVINSQLRRINMSLRKQARVESYAPSLSYAPVGSALMIPGPPSPGPLLTRDAASPILTKEKEPVETAAEVSGTEAEQMEALSRLRVGKRFLREQKPGAAVPEFEAALVLARKLGDPMLEKKAARGLGASYQRQNAFPSAIAYHQQVLAISAQSGETSGDTEAYGAIADCFTEIGDLEKAAKYYDKYIARLTGGDELDNEV
eukprot:TRINITY_DN9539_c0_g1_i1.p1 TRINITY_DN9539_c0_g1~~TRINITY_DN9539_c0_g1_i1.p1  ORF type:complete len:393 (+),score=66.35 TRINITY_DN9539_c0_g1_i1:352-1530(+)